MTTTFPRARVEELIALLGPPWHPAPCPYGQDQERQYVTDGRGAGFWLFVDPLALRREPADPHRFWITVRGRYPDVPGWFGDGDRPEIHFTLARPLRTLAEEVRRRFLPQYLAAQARAVEVLHAHSVAAGRRETLAENLVARFAGSWRQETNKRLAVHLDLEPYPGTARATVRINGSAEHVDVELLGIRPQDLEALWAIFEARQSAKSRTQPTPGDADTLDTVRLA